MTTKVEYSFYGNKELWTCLAHKFILGWDFEFTGKVKYYTFNFKKPATLQLQVTYTVYEKVFFFSEVRKKTITKWISADDIQIYEEEII